MGLEHPRQHGAVSQGADCVGAGGAGRGARTQTRTMSSQAGAQWELLAGSWQHLPFLKPEPAPLGLLVSLRADPEDLYLQRQVGAWPPASSRKQHLTAWSSGEGQEHTTQPV